MTTKKRSKPRALYQVFNKCGFMIGESFYHTRNNATSDAKAWQQMWPEDGPYEVVKYVRKVKRK